MSPLPLFMLLAMAPDGVQNATCSQAGLVFGVHSFGKSIVMKGPTGFLSTLELTDKMEMLRLDQDKWMPPKPGTQNEVAIGDLVCVSPQGDRVHVVPRVEVRKRQQAFLSEWQKKSVFGVLEKLDASARTMAIKPAGSSGQVEVKLAPDVRYRFFPSDATTVEDAKPFRAEELKPGEPVYVFGRRSADLKSIEASIVSRGGMRAFTGTIQSIDILNSTVVVKEAGTEVSLKVKVVASKLYRTAPAMKSPTEIVTPAGVPLTGVGFADVETGDSVLVIGRENAGEVRSVIVITAFGSFGVAADDPSGQITWLIQ